MKKVMILMLAGLLLICPMSIAEEGTEMQILITDGTHEIVFALNNTPAAKSLAAQLPLETEIENYGSNEKIFYPPEKLDGTEAIESGGEAGGLAYFSPWGNVVLYYDTFSPYPGLYILGAAVSGEDQIRQLSGTIQVIACETAEDETNP